MSLEAELTGILSEQAPSGAFFSTVQLPDGPVADENGFVTALVLLELSHLPPTPALVTSRERALDFLARCEVSGRPGAFSFYPPDGHPRWMPVQLLPDADDTALFALALVRGGRRPEASLAAVAREVLAPFRLFWLSGAARPWHRAGVYRTWLHELCHPNVVDLCVNVNVAVFLAAAGVGGELGLGDIVQMVERGVSWAGSSMERASLLSPYYPHPAELGLAVERAVKLGVTELAPCRRTLRTLPWARSDRQQNWPDSRPVCGSNDRRILWTAPVLQRARRLSASLEDGRGA